MENGKKKNYLIYAKHSDNKSIVICGLEYQPCQPKISIIRTENKETIFLIPANVHCIFVLRAKSIKKRQIFGSCSITITIKLFGPFLLVEHFRIFGQHFLFYDCIAQTAKNWLIQCECLVFVLSFSEWPLFYLIFFSLFSHRTETLVTILKYMMRIHT